MKRGVSMAVLAMALLGSAGARAQTVEQYSVGRGGDENFVKVMRDHDRITLDYSAIDNGRGPRTHEVITLGADKLPTSWRITGTSLFGLPLDEQFARDGAHLRWQSQAETGSLDTADKKLYITDDGSPFAFGLYAQALLKAPGTTLAALPYGQLTLVKVRDVTLAIANKTIKGSIYRLDGIDVTPKYVVLAANGDIIASGGAIRAGYEEAVRALHVDDDRAELMQAQTKLAHRFDGPVEIRNVRVLDPIKGALSALSTVTTFRGKVTGVAPYVAGAPIPPGSEAYDGAGGTLVPGLHDMHSHLTRRSGLFYLAAGVTSVREMGNRNDFLLGLIPDFDSGALAGPRVVPNGFLEGISPYSEHLGYLPATLDEGLHDVRWYADHGYFEIKIYNSMTPAWVKPLADEAHRLGMGVTGHVPAFMVADDVIKDGFNSIAHINQLMLGWVLKPGEDTRTTLRLTALSRFKDFDLASPQVGVTLDLMQQHHVALDPTLVIVERLMLSRPGTVQPGDADYLDHMPVAYQRNRRRGFVPLKTPDADATYRAAFGTIMKTMKMLDDRGIQLLPGTDDTTGFTVHRELELYTLAGMSAAQALRFDTIGADRYLHRSEDYGTIERGKASDFFLIPGDPLKDIRAIKSIALVMKGDAIYYPAEIYPYLGIKPFTPPPVVLAP